MADATIRRVAMWPLFFVLFAFVLLCHYRSIWTQHLERPIFFGSRIEKTSCTIEEELEYWVSSKDIALSGQRNIYSNWSVFGQVY
jgi:hypothetical protein